LHKEEENDDDDDDDDNNNNNNNNVSGLLACDSGSGTNYLAKFPRSYCFNFKNSIIQVNKAT